MAAAFGGTKRADEEAAADDFGTGCSARNSPKLKALVKRFGDNGEYIY